MRLDVRGYRGIDRAEIVIPDGGVTGIFGENMNGKTSVIEPLRHLIKGDPHPLGLHKKDMAEVIHDGCKVSEFTLETEIGTRKISLPECELRTLSGSGLEASDIALGLVKIAELPKDGLATLLSSSLNVTLGRERLVKELTEITVGENTKLDPKLLTTFVDTVFGTDKIKALGWDKGEKCARENALVLQRQFQTEAGIKWGKNQGMTFLPKGWEPDLTTAKLEDLQTAVTKAKEGVERAIATNAVSERELEELKIEAEKAPSIAIEIGEMEEAASAHSKDVDRLSAALESAKAKESAVKCSGCGIIGNVENGILRPLDQKHKDAGKSEGLADDLKKAKIEFTTASNKVSFYQAALKKSEEAKAKLEAAPAAGDTSIVSAAHELLAKATVRLFAFELKKKCTDFHMQITAIAKAEEIMGPEGLRRRVLVAALAAFNKELSMLCEMAGWVQVQIDNDLIVRSEGRNYIVGSKSEKYRVNATLQLAIAKIENAPIIVLDDADQLDRQGRNHLFGLLLKLKRTCVVGMAWASTSKGDPKMEVPRMKPPNASYWIAKGIVERLQAPVAVA